MNKKKLETSFNELKNYFTIFFLGVSASIPLSLISSTLKVFLNDEGLSLEFIGSLSLLTVPYSLKFLFAPIIDSCKIPFLSKKIGHRKSWIICSQILLAGLISLLGFFAPTGSALLIFSCGLLLAFASSCQDVVIDGYRIELFEEKLQAIAASFYIYGYRLGLLISGALALFLADRLAWQLVYLIMGMILLFCTIATLLAKESRPNWESKRQNLLEWFKQFVATPLGDFIKRPNWIITLLFITSFKLADGFAGNLMATFLREIGFNKTELAAILKTFGLVATMFGVLIGGLMVRKIGLGRCLWIAIALQGLSNLAFSLQAQLGHNIEILYWVIFVENLSGGIGDAVFIAYLSSLCNRQFSATQYALLSSFATLSRSVLAASAGIYADLFGWYKFFLLTSVLALPSLILLAIINKNLLQSSKKNA